MFKLCLFVGAIFLLSSLYLSAHGATSADTMTYADTARRYALRMSEPAKKFGPQVAQVYYAFENTTGAVWHTLEENDQLMGTLLNIFERYPNLPGMLHDDTSFSRAVALHLQDEDKAIAILNDLSKLDDKDMRMLSRQDSNPLIAAICMLMPGISSTPLKTMPKKNLQALFLLTRQIAPLFQQDSSFRSLPKSAYDIQMRVINAWGAEPLLDALTEAPALAQAIVPPIDFRDLEALQLQPMLYPGSAKLRSLQDVYIQFMRELYLQARQVRSPAWAAELCVAFADNVALSLFKNDDDSSRQIHSFLISFIQNGEIFTNLISPSRCYENGSTLNEIADALLLMEDYSLPRDLLSSLALWHADGQLARMLEAWSKNVKATDLSVELDDFNSMNLESRETKFSNMRFLISIAHLAQLRASLKPEQAKLLDQLLADLQIESDPPYVAPYFLAEYGDEFFNFMANHNFSSPLEVSRKIFGVGFPDNNSPSLYACFRSEQKRETCRSLQEILDKRGNMPETDLLRDGLLFAEKYGIESETLVDAGDFGLGVILTIATGGVGSVKLACTAMRIAMKTAVRQGVKQAIKKTTHFIVSPRKTGNQLTKRMGRLSGKLRNLPKNTASPEQSSAVQKTLTKLDRIHNGASNLKAAIQWFSTYMASPGEILPDPIEVADICPQDPSDNRAQPSSAD